MSESLPRVRVAKGLRPHGADINFNRWGFAEALDKMGMPESAISSLEVRFSGLPPSQLWPKSGRPSSYEPLSHVLTLYPLIINGTKREAALPPAWHKPDETSLLNRAINVVLAHESRHAVDNVLLLPAAAICRRHIETVHSRYARIRTGALAGALLGSEFGHPAISGSIIGASLVAGAGLASQKVSQLHTGENKAYRDALRAVEAVADSFAASTEAFDLFNGIVQIKLVPQAQT
ncbi:MAG TPA: hypothetical protein VLG37_01300 [Candidatus Saccharimonadales bacterium]|nr:hypothetical protein [Candidatus Saccharimonadales bacterium]